MRRARALAIACSMLVVGAISTSAAQAASFKAEGAVKGTPALETEIGEKLEAEEAKISLAIAELPSSSGTATIDLIHVVEPKSKTECQTEGASAGEVVVSGEFHVVWTSLSPLEAAVLFTFSEVVASCNSGKLKPKIRQSLLMHLNAPREEMLLSLGLTANCTKKGKQELKEYFNDEGKAIKAVLTANFGLGFETACLGAEKEVTLNAGSAFEIGTSVSGLPTIEAAPLTLPDVHVLSGDTYPVSATGFIQNEATLETELGEKLRANNNVTIEAELLELSASGPDVITLTDVREETSKTKCHTTGDSEGTVKVSGEYHVVDTSFSPLTAAVMFLFKELVAECNSGKLKVKVRSPWIVKLEKVTSGTDVSEYGLVSHCSGKGKQELRNYLNDAGEATKGALTANFGLGFEGACEAIPSELVVKSTKMLDFLF